MATALIAEDEPLLAMALRKELKALWPELEIVSEVGDGLSALQGALALKPQIMFMDIQMPEMTGIEAALELVDAWSHREPFPAIVFVTAYDEYALQAFEARAIDYLLKPVQSSRLARTIERLKVRLASDNELKPTGAAAPAPSIPEDTLAQLRALLQSGLTTPHARASDADGQAERLQVIQAGVGNQIRMIPIEDVVYFEAADKYVRVHTGEGRDWLIRKPLKELMAALDAAAFWQIHRGVIVRAKAIESVQRDETGKLSLKLRGMSTELGVSKLYAYLFKAM